MRDLCKWPIGHIYACVWLYVNYHVVMSNCFVCDAIFWRQTYLSFKFFLIFVYSLTSISVVILFQESADICEFSYLLYYYCFYAMKKKLEMHMRNKQYRTCRSQKSQRLVISQKVYLRVCRRLRCRDFWFQRKLNHWFRFEAEQCGRWMRGCRYADCFITFFHNN